jgi:hypothetical protein
MARRSSNRDPAPSRPPRGPGRQRSTPDASASAQRRVPLDDRRPLNSTFTVTLVDGERGRQLALVQARAIREVLTWWATQNTPQISSTLDDAA